MNIKTFGKEFTNKTITALPALIMPVLVLGGIYGGIVTPTEAAAIAVLYAIPIGLYIYKGLNGKKIVNVIIESATTTGVIMIMLYSVMILSRLYIMEDLPGIIMSFLNNISSSKYVMMLMINVFMIIIGMLMDDVSAVLLCTPVLLPVVTKIGISPVHFAAIIGVNLGLGSITPPCAPLLYFSARLTGTQVNEMMYPTFFMILFAWLPTLIVTTYVPGLSMFLPRLILGIN